MNKYKYVNKVIKNSIVAEKTPELNTLLLTTINKNEAQSILPFFLQVPSLNPYIMRYKVVCWADIKWKYEKKTSYKRRNPFTFLIKKTEKKQGTMELSAWMILIYFACGNISQISLLFFYHIFFSLYFSEKFQRQRTHQIRKVFLLTTFY